MKGKIALSLKRNSPLILTCVAAAGVVLTAVTAARATPKALKLLEKAKEEKGEELTKLEVVTTAAPAYIPSALIGASTIACIFGANALNKRQQAALTSAYALVNQTYKEYRGKLKELYGEEADVKIRDAIVKEKVEDIYVGAYGSNPLPKDGETRLFFDENSDRYFESTVEAVQNAEYHFNRNFSMRGYACLNELYEFLGLPATEEGSVLGWTIDRLIEEHEATWIDFDHRLIPVSDDGLECYVISTPIPPEVEPDED